jgi:hypothetical protein
MRVGAVLVRQGEVTDGLACQAIGSHSGFKRKGGKPHGGWKSSLELYPGSLVRYLKVHQVLGRGRQLRLPVQCVEQESTQGEGESPTNELVGLGGGEGHESIGFTLVVIHRSEERTLRRGNALKLMAHWLSEGIRTRLSLNPVFVQLDAVRAPRSR